MDVLAWQLPKFYYFCNGWSWRLHLIYSQRLFTNWFSNSCCNGQKGKTTWTTVVISQWVHIYSQLTCERTMSQPSQFNNLSLFAAVSFQPLVRSFQSSDASYTGILYYRYYKYRGFISWTFECSTASCISWDHYTVIVKTANVIDLIVRLKKRNLDREFSCIDVTTSTCFTAEFTSDFFAVSGARRSL